MTKHTKLPVRWILVMGAISALSAGCKETPSASRGGGSEPVSPGTEQNAGNSGQEEPAPEEAVPHVPDPTEIE